MRIRSEAVPTPAAGASANTGDHGEMAVFEWVSARGLAALVVAGLAIAAAACTPYQYSGNRPVALAVTVNGPGPMSPAGAPR